MEKKDLKKVQVPKEGGGFIPVACSLGRRISDPLVQGALTSAS